MANALRVIFTGSMCILSIICFAQNNRDTTFLSTASANAVKMYNDQIQGQSGLYNGSQYRQAWRTNEEHPFYKEYDWQQGSIEYNQEQYLNVGILYDVTADNIVIEHFYNGDEMVLVKAKVNSFTIGDDKFIHLTSNSDTLNITPGFYQLLYDGNSQVVVRHEKKAEDRIESHKVEVYFTSRARIYMFKDGSYHRVSNRGDVFKLFADKKAELRQFLQREKIKIDKANPATFARVAQYYDSITNGNK